MKFRLKFNEIKLIEYLLDQTDVESTTSSHQNGLVGNSTKRKPRTTSVRVPSVNVISEVAEGQMTRSQSVGHNFMTTASVDSSVDSNNLLNVSYHNGGTENSSKSMKKNGKTDGMRYTLSQPLLVNSSSESDHETKPLKESHKHWRSGTLSRPDIFYQVGKSTANSHRSIHLH